MKKSILLSFTFLFSVNTFAQTFQWLTGCGGTSGDYGNSIAVDDSGNSYITGWFQNTASFGGINHTSAGGYDLFIAKLNNAGQVVWALKGGGSGHDIGYGIAADNSGNIYVAGMFNGSATIGGQQLNSAGDEDIFVAKFTQSGNFIWIKTAGSSLDDQAQAIAVDNYGHVYISGYFKGNATFNTTPVTSSGNSDVFLAAYDTAGNLQWVEPCGGTSYDIGYGVTAGSSGKIYITGVFRSSASFGGININSSGDDDVYIAQFNSTGTCIWAKSYGGASLDKGIALVADANGVFATGWFTSPAVFGTTTLTGYSLDDIFILSLDTMGIVQWVTKAGGIGYDQGYGITNDANGDIYVTGSFDSVATFDSYLLTSNGSWDVFIAKYNGTTGVADWAVSGGGPASNTFERDIGYGIGTDTSDNVYVTGVFRNTATFGSFSVPSNGIQDIFVTKLSDEVNFISENSDDNRFIFYPNPVTDRIKFDVKGIKELKSIEIFNLTGEKVLLFESSDKMINEIPVGKLQEGIYFIRMLTEEKQYTGKFIKANE